MVKKEYVYPIYDESLLTGCNNWEPIKHTKGYGLVLELKQNRIQHQRCYLKWKGLVESIRKQQKKS